MTNIIDKALRTIWKKYTSEEDRERITRRKEELVKVVRHEYVLYMQKNIVLNMMLEPVNHKLFKEKRIRIIIPKKNLNYYGCAIKIDIPVLHIQDSLENQLFPSKDKQIVKKVIDTLDLVMKRYLDYQYLHLFNLQLKNQPLPKYCPLRPLSLTLS